MRISKLEVNQKYGNLTLVKKLDRKDKHGACLWLCRCGCGNEKIVPSSKVRRGDSCGCVALRHHASRGPKIGQRFGKLVIIQKLNKVDKFRSRKYICQCDCGNQKIISSHNLAVGNTKSCGCLGHVKLEYGEAAFNQLYLSYKTMAKRRHLAFDLSKEGFRKLTKLDCNYCGATPNQVIERQRGNGKYIYNGVDRVDPTIGYVPTNCVSCCGVCNTMKMDRSKEDFIKQVRLIYAKQVAGG